MDEQKFGERKVHTSLYELGLYSLSGPYNNLFSFTVSYTSLVEEGLFKCKKHGSKDLPHCIHMLEKLCLKPERDSHKLHLKRKRAQRVMIYVIKHCNPGDLKDVEIIPLLWSMILLLHHFQVRIKSSNGIVSWSRKRDFANSLVLFRKLIEFVPRSFQDIIICGTHVFFFEARLWKLEYLCNEILKILMSVTENQNLIIGEMLMCYEKQPANSLDALNIIHALYCLVAQCPVTEIAPQIIKTLLYLYEQGVNEDISMPIKKGILFSLQLLLRYVCTKNRESIIQIIFDFLCVLETQKIGDEIITGLTDSIMQGSFFRTLLETDRIREQIFRLWNSENLTIIRCLCNFFIVGIDSCNNKGLFKTARIFLHDGEYNINTCQSKSKDHRKVFYIIVEKIRQCYMRCVVNFREKREILERLYCILCLLLCEWPSGFAITSVACLALGIQNYAVEKKDSLSFEFGCHLHATVVGLLSFICYLRKVEEFYSYVNKIIFLRSKYAPHMNPPLRNTYEPSKYSILCSPSQLLFNKWEIRFGLWKCFRIKGKKYVPTKMLHISKKQSIKKIGSF